MAILVAVALVALVLIVLAFVVKNRHATGSSWGERESVWPFFARKPLTRPEQVLYHRLVKALPHHIVLAQVQASRVLGVKKGFNFTAWQNRVNRLSIDFLVCLKDATVVAAIELDDASHETPRRQEADHKKERALAAAGIPIVRWSVRDLPSETTIQAAFGSKPEASTPEPAWIAD